MQSHYPAARRYAGFWNGSLAVIHGNPEWEEKTGRVWNDWSWKPQPQDVMPKRKRALVKLETEQ